MRKFPAVLLPLPLGEVSPQVTERAHAVRPSAKALNAIRNFPTMLKAPSQRELSPQATEGVQPLFRQSAEKWLVKLVIMNVFRKFSEGLDN